VLSTAQVLSTTLVLSTVHGVKTEGQPQDQELFFPRMDQSRLGNDVLFFPEILLFKLGKRNWKKEMMLTKPHDVWLKASSSGCKIFFHFPQSLI